MIDFSKKRLARANDEKISVRQLAVAELMAWGWDPVDAMLAVGLIKESDSKTDAQHTAVNFTASRDFQKIYKRRVAQLKGGSVLDEYQKIHPTPGSSRSKLGRPRDDGKTRKEWQGDLPEPVSDEELLATIWETIEKLDIGDPKRVDLLDKYDKLKRRQGAGEEDTTIHFYLPRPECDTCPFRGNHIITEPELAEKKAAEEAKPENTPKVKHPYRKRNRSEDDAQEASDEEPLSGDSAEEAIDLFEV